MYLSSVKILARSSELCPHLFVLQSKHQQKQKSSAVSSRICLVDLMNDMLLLEKRKECSNHLLVFFHGIHYFCPELYLWYNIKVPNEPLKLFEPFLEEGISIMPAGKMHEMHFLYCLVLDLLGGFCLLLVFINLFE